jgi:RNA polymerase sigma factor (TIGR02999 family)
MVATTAPNQVTRLLMDWQGGNKTALDQLMPLVYHELRKLAGGYLRSERPDHTLQPTALLHEAYVRMIEQEMPHWQSRAHFFGVAARLMRQILVDHARTKKASKRGGALERVTMADEAPIFNQHDAGDLLSLDEALTKLASMDERKARILEMRTFGGMDAEETALALGISEPTVKRDLRLARAWLRRELETIH